MADVSPSGYRVQLQFSVDVAIDDPAQLIEAAIASVSETCFTNDGDEEAYATAIRADPTEALLWLADPILAVDHPGVDADGWTISVEPSAGAQACTPPDFEEILPPPCQCESNANGTAEDIDYQECPDCPGWSLTPNTAYCLFNAASVLIDEFRSDLSEHNSKPVEEDSYTWQAFYLLPRTTWNQSFTWRRKFIQSCIDLQEDLSKGDWPSPRCYAEEMALHLIIDGAQGQEDLDLTGSYDPRRDDHDWDTCSDIFFQDHDVLMIDSFWTPGIDDPDDRVNRYGGVGDMRPEHWYSWFNNMPARDPRRLLADIRGTQPRSTQ